MSSIENVLLEGIAVGKKYLKTFASLILSPIKVLSSLLPHKYGAEKFFNPFLFFLFSILPTVFLFARKNSNVDFSTLADSLPGFMQNLSVSQIILLSLPYLIGGYLYTKLMSYLFYRKETDWGNAYRKYLYYSMSLFQLSMVLCVAIQAMIVHVFYNDIIQSHQLFIMSKVLLFIALPAVIIIPTAIASIHIFWKTNKNNFIKFILVPIISPLFLISMLAFTQVYFDYGKDYAEMPDNILCAETDSRRFIPEIRMYSSPHRLFLTISLTFYNPTNKVYWLPQSLGMDCNDEMAKYIANDANKFNRTLWFFSTIPYNHRRDSLLLKPNSVKSIEYKCIVRGDNFNSMQLFWEKGNGYFSPLLKMEYTDFLNNQYTKKSVCYMEFVKDSTVKYLWPKDSLK